MKLFGCETLRWLHPCAIGDLPHLVHHPLLAQRDPVYFHALQQFARNQRWTLLRDRRQAAVSGADCPSGPDCRRRWLPLVVLGCALALPVAAQQPEHQPKHSHHVGTQAAETAQSISNKTYAAAAVTTELHLMHTTAAPASGELAKQSYDLLALATAAATPRNDVTQSQWQQRIHQILQARWQRSENDPDYLAVDLAQMAEYFSHYGEIRDLFMALENSDWHLRYAAQTFSTHVMGTRLRVDSATVYFDSRSAVQFKFQHSCATKIPFCIAAPADVLLHELLHVRTAMLQSQVFIAQGGMNGQLYPHAHEQHTINLEKNLYRAMTRVDQVPRPLRSEHWGRHVAAVCATCLQ